MKKYVLLLLLFSFLDSASLRARDLGGLCESFFARVSEEVSNDDVQFLRNYSDAAKVLQKETIDPQTLSSLQSTDYFEPAKIRFIRKKYADLRMMLSKEFLSMSDLLKARLFIAEDVSEQYTPPLFYVLIIGDRVYAFPTNKSGYTILNSNKIDFTEAPKLKALRLDRKYILRITEQNRAKLSSASNKDPMFLADLVKAGKVPANFAKLFEQFKYEFYQILLTTDLTIPVLLNSEYEPAKVTTATEDGQAYFFKTEKGPFYLVNKPKLLNSNRNAKWGELTLQPHMGFEQKLPAKVTFLDGVTFNVNADVIELPHEVRANNLLLSFMNIVDTAKTSHYRDDFISKYGNQLKDLIAKGLFHQASFQQVMYGLEVAVPALNLVHPLYILHGRDGYFYFEIDGSNYGDLASISQEKYGSTFYISNNQIVVLRKLSGFLDRGYQQVSDDISEVPANLPEGTMREKAFFTKMQIALRKDNLTSEQKQVLIQVKMLLPASGVDLANQALRLNSEQLQALGTLVKEQMVKNGAFSLRDADEFIKVVL